MEDRLVRVEHNIDAKLERIEEAIDTGFKAMNGRTAKVEATCAERGRTCPGIQITRTSGPNGTVKAVQGVMLTPKQVGLLIAGIVALALGAVFGPTAAGALVGKFL